MSHVPLPLRRRGRSSGSRLASTAAALALASCGPANHAMAPITAAAEAWSCPANRLSKVEVPARGDDEPPEDIARDPERLEMWRRSHPANTERRYAVAGCGEVAVFSCKWSDSYTDGDGNSVYDWYCTGYGPLRYPVVLEELAAKLEAKGHTAEAEALRSKADDLRRRAQELHRKLQELRSKGAPRP